MRIVVAGAGFAGLIAAYRLVQAGLEVVVLEARDRSAAGCGPRNSSLVIPGRPGPLRR